MNWNQLSRMLYKASRLSRDLNAVSRGPEATAKRAVNKAVYRKGNQLLARALRSFWKGL